MKTHMWTLNTIKFKILETFILKLWYREKSQLWSHIKYDFFWNTLIVPKHKEIFRGTLNNIFKIIAHHKKCEKKEIEAIFLESIWK